MQLNNYFGINVSVYFVKPDGNCISHIILRNQEYYSFLQSKLIARFVAWHIHFFNVMRESGILSDQELQEHIKSVSEQNA